MESFSIRHLVRCDKTLLHQTALSNLHASWLSSHRAARIDGHGVGRSASRLCSCGKVLLPRLGGEEEEEQESNGKCYLLFSGKKTPNQLKKRVVFPLQTLSPLLTCSTYLPLLQFSLSVLAPYHSATKTLQSLASFQSGYII